LLNFPALGDSLKTKLVKKRLKRLIEKGLKRLFKKKVKKVN